MAVKKRRLRIKTRQKGGKITTFGRRQLKSSQFALAPSPEQKRRGIKGRFPIDTKARARNALARGVQAVKRGFISRAQLSIIRRKVRIKFPSIKVTTRKKTRK